MSEHEPQHEHEDSRCRPRIWVASLADHATGHPHGAWIDATLDSGAMLDQVRHMLTASPEPSAAAWAILDHDGFGGYRIDQDDTLTRVGDIARGITEHGLAFAAWVSDDDGDPAKPDEFLDDYCGEYDSPEAWAQEMLDDFGLPRHLDETVPSPLRPFVRIDFAGFARDAALGGDMVFAPTDTGRVWAFHTS